MPSKHKYTQKNLRLITLKPLKHRLSLLGFRMTGIERLRRVYQTIIGGRSGSLDFYTNTILPTEKKHL